MPLEWHDLPITEERASLLLGGVDSMPTQTVVLSDHQQLLVDSLVQSGRYQNASEVLRDGLRLVEDRERMEDTKLKTLKQATRLGWSDISAGRYADVPDDHSRISLDVWNSGLEADPSSELML